jgi:hypothetical protein
MAARASQVLREQVLQLHRCPFYSADDSCERPILLTNSTDRFDAFDASTRLFLAFSPTSMNQRQPTDTQQSTVGRVRKRRRWARRNDLQRPAARAVFRSGMRRQPRGRFDSRRGIGHPFNATTPSICPDSGSDAGRGAPRRSCVAGDSLRRSGSGDSPTSALPVPNALAACAVSTRPVQSTVNQWDGPRMTGDSAQRTLAASPSCRSRNFQRFRNLHEHGTEDYAASCAAVQRRSHDAGRVSSSL